MSNRGYPVLAVASSLRIQYQIFRLHVLAGKRCPPYSSVFSPLFLVTMNIKGNNTGHVFVGRVTVTKHKIPRCIDSAGTWLTKRTSIAAVKAGCVIPRTSFKRSSVKGVVLLLYIHLFRSCFIVAFFMDDYTFLMDYNFPKSLVTPKRYNPERYMIFLKMMRKRNGE